MSISRMVGGEAVRIEMSWSYWAVVEELLGGVVSFGLEVGGGKALGEFRWVVGLISLGEM